MSDNTEAARLKRWLIAIRRIPSDHAKAAMIMTGHALSGRDTCDPDADDREVRAFETRVPFEREGAQASKSARCESGVFQGPALPCRDPEGSP